MWLKTLVSIIYILLIFPLNIWEKNPKIPCNLTKPEKHTLNLSEIVPPEPHISQGGGGGGGY